MAKVQEPFGIRWHLVRYTVFTAHLPETMDIHEKNKCFNIVSFILNAVIEEIIVIAPAMGRCKIKKEVWSCLWSTHLYYFLVLTR